MASIPSSYRSPQNTVYRGGTAADFRQRASNQKKAASKLTPSPGSPGAFIGPVQKKPGMWTQAFNDYVTIVNRMVDEALGGMPEDQQQSAGPGSGGGRGGGGGGFVFDPAPYDAMRARINSQSDASKRYVGQMQAELVGRLNEHSAQYKQAADKLAADLAAQQQTARQAGSNEIAAVQQDLAQQGVNAQAVAAQAQVQEQNRAQAEARQQDYMTRLAQLAAQNSSDRRTSADTMFAGLNSQAELMKNQQLAAIDSQQFDAQMGGRGGGGGGGGGGRGGGGGGGSTSPADMTDGALARAYDEYNRVEQIMNPMLGFQDWTGGFAGTLYGDKQRVAQDYFTRMVDALARGNVSQFEQMRKDIDKAEMGRDANYNRQVLRQGASEALTNYRKAQQAARQFANFRKLYGG